MRIRDSSLRWAHSFYSTNLIPNHSLKSQINQWREEQVSNKNNVDICPFICCVLRDTALGPGRASLTFLLKSASLLAALSDSSVYFTHWAFQRFMALRCFIPDQHVAVSIARELLVPKLLMPLLCFAFRVLQRGHARETDSSKLIDVFLRSEFDTRVAKESREIFTNRCLVSILKWHVLSYFCCE